MAVQTVTTTPTALTGITTGFQYAVQNRGSRAVRISVTSSAPSASTEDYFIIGVGYYGRENFGYPTASSGESIYVWTDSETSTVAYDTTS